MGGLGNGSLPDLSAELDEPRPEHAAEHVSSTQLDANRATFDTLVRRATGAAARNPALAAALAQAAAEFAWFNHTGWYASASLERLLGALGSSLPPARSRAGTGSTLHVATQVYETGGSTQSIVAWTDELADRSHHLAATRQATVPLPRKVTDRLGDRVTLSRLDTRPGSLLARAARLRRLAAGSDLVLVSSHPYDVVPALAFADRRGLPPVVLVDQADHVFWVGATSVDHVMHLRTSGQQLALTRRGLPPERSLVRNRPLAFRSRTTERSAAKAEWGVSADAVLLLSAAEATKFVPLDGPHLADLVEPALRDRPDLVWLVAGPAPDDEPWAELARRTQGRVRALGRVSDMSVLHQAADLFLDSFPFASLTSLLESAALGNPVVTYRGHPETCGVFGADSPGVDELMFRPADPGELVRVLLSLVDDADLRARAGGAGAAAVVAGHGGGQWREGAESLYALPSVADSSGRPPVHGTGLVDEMTRGVMAATAHRRDRDEVVASHLGTLPPTTRWAQWRRLPEARPRFLVPEWAPALVRKFR